MNSSDKELVRSESGHIRPTDHLPNCHLVLFNGNGKCDCGEDKRWEAEYVDSCKSIHNGL